MEATQIQKYPQTHTLLCIQGQSSYLMIEIVNIFLLSNALHTIVVWFVPLRGSWSKQNESKIKTQILRDHTDCFLHSFIYFQVSAVIAVLQWPILFSRIIISSTGEKRSFSCRWFNTTSWLYIRRWCINFFHLSTTTQVCNFIRLCATTSLWNCSVVIFIFVL